MSDKLTAASLARTLIQGAVSYAGGEVGAFVIDALLGRQETVPSYFDQVYQEIRKSLRKVVEDEELRKAEVVFHDAIGWIRNTYLSDPESYQKELGDEIADVRKTVSNLTVGSLQLPGFPGFLLGAALHLSLLAEKRKRQGDPSKSTESIERWAGDYRLHIQKVWPLLLKQRKNQIRIASRKVPAQKARIRTVYDVHDDVLSGPVAKDLSREEQASRERDVYLSYITLKFEADVGYPPHIADCLQQLSTKDSSLPTEKEKPLGGYPHLADTVPIWCFSETGRINYAYRYEASDKIKGWSGNWTRIGSSGFAALEKQLGSSEPVSAWIGKSNRWFRYIAGSERLGRDWQKGSIKFYAFPSQEEGTVPVYEYRSRSLDSSYDGWYFYTPFPGGAAKWRSTWERQRIAFYAFPSPTPSWAG